MFLGAAHFLVSLAFCFWLLTSADSQGNVRCPSDTLFTVNPVVCFPCDSHATSQKGECVCDSDAVRRTTRPTCVRCAFGTQPATWGQRCLPCATNGSIDEALVESTVNASSGQCACADGYALLDRLGHRRLNAVWCQRCGPRGHVDATRRACVYCDAPKRWNDAAARCVCAENFTELSDGTCVNSSQVFRDAVLEYSPPNVDNEGRWGAAVLFALDDAVEPAVVKCRSGDLISCNAVANICVLQLYAIEALSCRAFVSLFREQDEVKKMLPRIFYTASSVSILHNSHARQQVAIDSKLDLWVAVYHLNGTLMALQPLSDQISPCALNPSQVEKAWRVGSVFRASCYLNLRWFGAAAPTTVLYELYIQHEGGWKPIPVLLFPNSPAMFPSSFRDALLRRFLSEGGRTPLPPRDGFRRRFFLYDNAGGRRADGTVAFSTFVRRAELLLSIASSERSAIDTPLLLLQYASTELRGEVGAMRNVAAATSDATAAELCVRLTTEPAEMTDWALLILLVVSAVIGLSVALLRTYSWTRRRQWVVLDTWALVRFGTFALEYASNLLVLGLICGSLMSLALYKLQRAVAYAPVVEMPSVALAIVGVVAAAKLAVVSHALHAQCTYDVFVFDWERSHGSLQGTKKNAPISLWRGAFIINEWNELQVYRLWSPLLCMFFIEFFLEGVGLIRLATLQPTSEIGSSRDDGFGFSPWYRLAASSAVWLLVCGTQHYIQHYLYFRFFALNPLDGFLDLCSVSNISVALLLEPQWGWYIHGASLHPHTEVTSDEFEKNLKLESEGKLPARGLGDGRRLAPTFEIFIGSALRALCDAWIQLAASSLGKEDTADEVRIARDEVTAAWKQSVQKAERCWLPKRPLHRLLDITPNILYMNGPTPDKNSAKGGDSFEDLYVADDTHQGFAQTLMSALDLQLWMLELAVFWLVDFALTNTFVAMGAALAIDSVVVGIKSTFGTANIARKSMVNERFLI